MQSHRRRGIARGRPRSYNKAYYYERSLKSLDEGAAYSYAFYMPRGAITGTVPLVIAMGGAGSSELTSEAFCEQLVTNVPPVAAYAIAARGEGMGRNHVPTRGGYYNTAVLELADLRRGILDAIAKLGALWNGKIAVRGKSKGGMRSFWAAAYSGKVMPTYGSDRGWYPVGTKFPDITMVCPWHSTMDFPWANTTNGEAITHHGSFNLIANPELQRWDEAAAIDGNTEQGNYHDQILKAAVEVQVRADSVAGYEAIFTGDARFSSFFDTIPTELIDTQVDCIYCQVAPTDKWQFLGITYLDSLKAITSDAKVIVNVAPGGHGSPDNTSETLNKSNRELVLLKHYLLGASHVSAAEWSIFGNGATSLATVSEMRWVIRPRSDADFIDPASTWGEAFYTLLSNWDSESKTAAYPYAATLNLGTGGTGSDTVANTWLDATFDADDYSDLAVTSTNVTTTIIPDKLPLGEQVYTLADLGADRLIAGEIDCTLKVSSDSARFVISAAFYDWDGVDETFICHGWKVVTGYVSGVVDVAITTFPVIYKLESGNQLRMRVRNIPYADMGNASGPQMAIMPIFEDFSLELQTNTTDQSSISVPIIAVATQLD